MADLDNFFAKKDKKKKGKGKKYTSKTPQTLAEPPAPSQEDDSASKDVKIDIPSAQSKDEEWIEETEVVEDLEGLKVAPLKQDDSEDGLKPSQPLENTDDTEQGDNAETNTQKSVASPWQQVTTEDDEVSDEEKEEAIEPPKPAHPADAVTSGGKYIPPSLRRGAQATPTSSPGARRNRTTAPPDIGNTQAFPSLHASVVTPKKTDKDFTEVKGSKKTSRPLQETGYSVELTNKFSSLS